MFPEIPADLNALSATELYALAAKIKEVALANLTNSALGAEDRQTTMDMVAARTGITALADQKKAADDAKAALENEDEVPVPAPAPGAPVPTGPEGDDPGDEGGDDDADGEASDKSKAPKAPPTTTGLNTISAPAPAPKGPELMKVLTASDGVTGKKPGEGFASWGELSVALMDRGNNVNANTSERFTVGTVTANYPAERQLSDNKAINLAKFEPDEMMAALCAPATPYYDMHCMNVVRRPVFNGLPQFAAPRMKVSIMPSPALSDITNGIGQWTAANEASTNAVKAACQTITCGSPTEFQVYGVYRCMTIRNMLAMSYPELVEAWLNRLQAAQARLAEQLLLNAMATTAPAISAPVLGYGAATTITTTLLNYLTLFQETQRWDLTENLELWGHRWILNGMKLDLARRRNTSGAVMKIVTDEDINAMFRNAGFNPHWFIDTPTWSSAVPAVSTGGTLNRLPVDANFLIFRPGKYALMDRGNLNIGVTGNNIYRDNNSNARNEFTMFWESFEGVVDTGDCGANVLTIPGLCFSGVQQDDAFMNCQGLDEPGYQS